MDVTFGGSAHPGELVYRTDFARLDDFWWEGSPDIRSEGNRLVVRTMLERDPQLHFMSSVFLRREFAGDVLVEYEGRSVHERSERNFKFFVHTRMRDGHDLYETRGERTGNYGEYHVMDNYLFTCLKSERRNADGTDMFRVRMRRNPGFVLRKEVHAYACENFRWYRFAYMVRGGEVAVSIDGRPELTYSWTDEEPLAGGYLGFRTYMSHLELRDLAVYALK